MSQANRSDAKGVVDTIEETAIAVLLGGMTLLTFINVVLRYGFNSSIIWSLEVVLVMFAWLVLFGISYGFKVTAHLGVDAVTNLLPPGARKAVALFAGALCIAYAALFVKGAWIIGRLLQICRKPRAVGSPQVWTGGLGRMVIPRRGRSLFPLIG